MKPTFHTQEDKSSEEDEPATDAWIGRTLSNVYEIHTKIGEGGMGSVYLARHIHLKKSFAIKVLSDAVASKDNAVERLKLEAISAANIDHENIVDVVNFDRTEDGAVFIVMEALKGESLAETIGRGPVQLHRALPITYQICRALQAAHEHDIVHRDLKPENVFLTEKSGRTLVKVLDFGISKIKTADAEQVRMTRTGQLVGTPLYMSPEQARGETDIDRRVDVYAMGVMLYEMITGAPPFEGRNYFELLWKHGNEPAPSMSSTNPNIFIPDPIQMTVARALEKDPDRRFQTMLELEEALMRAAPEIPSLPPPPSLPAEGSEPRPKGRSSEFGRAPTEMMSSGEDLEPGEGAGDEEAAKPASPSEIIEVPQRNLMPMVVVGIGALALIGAIGYAMIGPSEAPVDALPEPPAPTAEVTAPPAAPEAVTPEEVPPPGIDPPPGPATVTVEVNSSPPGAVVRIGDEELGQTPLEVTRPLSDEPVELRFERPGFAPRTVELTFIEGAQLDAVRLTRRRAAQPSGDDPPLPIKNTL